MLARLLCTIGPVIAYDAVVVPIGWGGGPRNSYVSPTADASNKNNGWGFGYNLEKKKRRRQQRHKIYREHTKDDIMETTHMRSGSVTGNSSG